VCKEIGEFWGKAREKRRSGRVERRGRWIEKEESKEQEGLR
jgi:hypothetical protein